MNVFKSFGMVYKNVLSGRQGLIIFIIFVFHSVMTIAKVEYEIQGCAKIRNKFIIFSSSNFKKLNYMKREEAQIRILNHRRSKCKRPNEERTNNIVNKF